MEHTNKELVIFLPEGMEDMTVKVFSSKHTEGLVIDMMNLPKADYQEPPLEKCHALVWHNNDYEHLRMDEIIWIEANGSYCCIHASDKRTFTLSYPLNRIERSLPVSLFMRIQRSFLVNINHIKKLTGNSILIDGHIIKIGERYKSAVLDRFVFLGVRNNPLLKKKRDKKD